MLDQVPHLDDGQRFGPLCLKVAESGRLLRYNFSESPMGAYSGELQIRRLQGQLLTLRKALG